MPFDNPTQIDFRLPAPKVLTAQELMATPEHMLAWLRSKHPDEIVTGNLGCANECLGGCFFAAHGAGEFPWIFAQWGWFEGAYYQLLKARHTHDITASQAIRAIEGGE